MTSRSPRRRKLAAAAVLLATALLPTACRRAPGAVVYDFAAWLPAAEEHLAGPPGDGAADPARTPPAALGADGDEVLVRFGRRIDYYLTVHERSALVVEALTVRGSRGGSLTVEIEPAGGRARELASLEVTERSTPGAFELPSDLRGIMRLSFVARSERSPARGGIVLHAPALRSLARGAEEPAAESPAPRPAPASRPNVILYVIDTLRADALGSYGQPRPLSPHLDAFAEGAWVFEDAIAQSPWTRASVASIFTGLEPDRHRVNDRDEALSPDLDLLAEVLAAAGYHTAAVITNENAGPKFGFDQGFERFSLPTGLGLPSAELNERLLPMLDTVRGEQPFFLYAHSIGPHAPYEPPSPYRERFVAPGTDPALGSMDVLKEFRELRRQVDEAANRDITSLYDAETAFHDSLFGEFVERLRALDLFDGSLILVSSDHGEEFWEHDNWGHGHTLFDEVLRVPLLLKEPHAGDGRRIDGLVQHVDLFPTILDYAGVPLPAGIGGRSLRTLARGPRVPAPPAAFTFMNLDRRRAKSVIAGDWKLIVPLSLHLGSEPLLYHRGEDPAEARNRAPEQPVITGYLAMLLRAREAALEAGTATTTDIDEELADRLRALGYLQ